MGGKSDKAYSNKELWNSDKDIRLYKDRNDTHSKLEVIHDIEKINQKGLINALADELRNLQNKRQSIQTQGNILIKEIVKLLAKTEQTITYKEEQLLKKLRFINYGLQEDNITNIIKISFSVDFIKDFINYSNHFVASFDIQEFSKISLEKILLKDMKHKENQDIKENKDIIEKFQIKTTDIKYNDDNEIF